MTTFDEAIAIASPEPRASWYQRLLVLPRRARGRLALTLAVGWIVLVLVLAVFADVLPFIEPFDQKVAQARMGPGFRFDEPLGTDYLGRSMLSRLAYGGRISLAVGLGAVVFGAIVGGTLGLLAGYFRGWVDSVFNVIFSSVLAFPSLVLLLAMMTVLGHNYTTLIGGLALLSVPYFGRLSRATALSLRDREFVLASRCLGAGHTRIMFRELLPNLLLTIGAYAFVIIATVIVAEGSLSFLGYGIPPPQPSWGGMVAAGRADLSFAAFLVFVPAAFLLLTVLAFNVIGDYARDRADKRVAAL